MAQQPPARVGDALVEVDTPALLVELEPFERNLQLMTDSVLESGVRLRPHAKTHKCPEIAAQQIALGAVGVCCQKVSEAEVMVKSGVGDVFVANEVVGRSKLARLATLAKSARVSVCVDDATNVAELDAAARAEGVAMDVLVEVDVGGGRCGVAPGEPAAILAQLVAKSEHLRFAGLHAYQGKAQHLAAVDERRAAAATAITDVTRSRDRVAAAGLECRVITGGGTGTFLFECASGVYNEIQPGSYIFMDASYGRNDWDGFPLFEQSLFVWTTIMSASSGFRVVDAGLKASSTDSGMPRVDSWPGLEYVRASDEHGVIEITPGAKAPGLGTKLRLVPGHCDPTVNLHDWLVCVRRESVEAVWPITARGASF